MFSWNQTIPFREQRGVARRPKQGVFLFACVATTVVVTHVAPRPKTPPLCFYFFAVFDIVVSPLPLRHS